MSARDRILPRQQEPRSRLSGLAPPIGRSGRAIGGGQSYSIAGVKRIRRADRRHLRLLRTGRGWRSTPLIHEEGAGQLEINLRHGDPVELADQVFMFKRTIREAALKHDTYATFMAKPIQGQPGSAMHIHQSHRRRQDRRERSSLSHDGAETETFRHFVGGMQRHVPSALVMLAPYVNSYRRLTRSASAPVNTRGATTTRTTAFRIPRSDAQARRVENRIPSSDANPYLAFAASLACGLIGIMEKVACDNPTGAAVNEDEIELPRGLLEAVALFEADTALREVLGDAFIATYAAIKKAEFETFMEVISPGSGSICS